MPGENLTQEEARKRASLVHVHRYEVELDLTTGSTTFGSRTTITFHAVAGASTFVDAITAKVRSIVLNGVELDPHVSDGVRIHLTGLAEENTLIVDADAYYTNTGEGLHRFVDPVDGETYLYTQFEVPDTRRMYATFEQPDLKGEFALAVTAPASWVVLSNSPTPTPELLGEDTARWTFSPTPRIAPYITALVAGPYVGRRGELTSSDGRTIPLGVYCRASLAEHLDPEAIMETTRKGFAFYEKQFEYPYPFEKYDQIFVPEFNAGAMENAGCVTFTEAYVFRSQVTDAMRERRVVTILHELAHMWFGDLVTMRWWNDLWLNESFAEFMSTLATVEATEWVDDWATFAASEKSWAYAQDQLPTTHPIVAPINDLEDVQVNFDGITYAKGASVLKQLVAWVGRDQFFAGVHSYFVKHAHGNTELRDLLTELESTSGRDLHRWSNLWLETAGVNTLRPRLSVGDDGTINSFEVVQTTPTDHPTQRPHRLGIGFYDRSEEGAIRRTSYHEVDIDGEATSLSSLVGRKRPDLILLNDRDLAYAKIRLDEASLDVAVDTLAGMDDPLTRGLIWSAVWDATRDAEISARRWLHLVETAAGAETGSTTLRYVLAQAQLAASRYVSPEHRDAETDRLADALWSLAEKADPGSDRQFQFVTNFARVASKPRHANILRALLEGSRTLPGLTIDTDLAWELLEGLVALGQADENEINAALAHDDTATGHQAAARVRAALPTPEAKIRALTRLLDDDTLPNLIVRNTATGLRHVVDPTILDGLVEPYFASIESVWRDRTYHIAEEIIVGAFPAPLANQRLLDAARRWLDAHPDTPALRRLILEPAAGVERALAAQRADR